MKIVKSLFFVVLGIVLVWILFNPILVGLGDILAYGVPGQVVRQYPSTLAVYFEKHHLTYVPIANIPLCAQEGIISVEDKRFYQNDGIDPIAIVRVLLMSTTNDHTDHGGSTLTQQLARLIIREPRMTLNSLTAVASLARVFHYTLILNHDFGKRKILELYLNSVYFGRKATGIAQAANAYFNTDILHLTLGQCLYLTGLPQAPSVFGKKPQGKIAIGRYYHVLATMVRNQYLTLREAEMLAHENIFAHTASSQ